MKKLKKIVSSLLIFSLTLASLTPVFGQNIIFNGVEHYIEDAINIDNHIFLSRQDINNIFGENQPHYPIEHELNPQPIEIDGVVFIPIRAFSERLDLNVNWQNNTVIITIPQNIQNENTNVQDVSDNLQIKGGLTRVTYGNNTAYIFGSVHAGISDWFPLADIVEDAMKSADIFAFETNLWNPSPEEENRFSEIMTELLFLPNNETVANLLPYDIYNHYVDIIESFGLEYENIRNINPVVLLQELNNNFITPLAGISWDYSVDTYVFDMATSLGVSTIGLVPLYTEIETLFTPPFEAMIEQIQMFPLFEELEQASDEQILIVEIVNAYEKNDIQTMQDLMADFFSLYDATTPLQLFWRDVISYERSIAFGREIARLLTETESETVFFVTLGISHVVRTGTGIDNDGITNVVVYLQNAGFDVEVLY
ncbi:MAG: TraB/GumN family protein [Defluviitaleaceae bacterium]|nr:TraB/GumN family protein [Defluviitaleaceae bacterium]